MEKYKITKYDLDDGCFCDEYTAGKGEVDYIKVTSELNEDEYEKPVYNDGYYLYTIEKIK